MYLHVPLPCISKGGIFPRELPCMTHSASAQHAPCMPPLQACPPLCTTSLPSSRLPSLVPLSSQGLFGFTIVNAATNCNSGSTWSSTGLTPCTACSTCMESGVTRLCDRYTDAVCAPPPPPPPSPPPPSPSPPPPSPPSLPPPPFSPRSAATVTLTLVAAGSVSDYDEQRKTNLQIKFALAAGVRAASTLSFPIHHPTSPPLASSLLPPFFQH